MRRFELGGISNNFGAIQALTGVNLKIDASEVLGLMGDNGAGKSTLIKIMAGNFLPSGGEIGLQRRESRVPLPGQCAQERLGSRADFVGSHDASGTSA